MKKMLLVVILFMLMSMMVYAEETEVILPGDLEAGDDFESFSSLRWSNFENKKWLVGSGVLQAKHNHGDKYIYQPYDYNSGTLKSSDYHFSLKLYEQWSKYRTGGLMLLESPDGFESDFEKVNVAMWNGHIITRIGGVAFSDTNSLEANRKELNYDVYLKRIEHSNTFDVTIVINMEDRGPLIHRGQIIMEHIYPAIWAYDGSKARFDSFEATHEAPVEDSIAIIDVRQIEDEVRIAWDISSDDYEKVMLFYDEDTIEFGGNDSLFYSGSGDTGLIQSLIPVNMRENDTVIAAQGKTNETTIESDVVSFTYLDGVEKFTYENTGKPGEYVFEWHPVVDALHYELHYKGSTLTRNSSTLTATLKDIEDPSAVYIQATKNADLGPGTSKSIKSYAVMKELAAVDNFNYTIVDNRIVFSWDAYPGATSYELFKTDGSGNFVKMMGDINTNTQTVDYDNLFISSDFKIKAVVNGSKTPDSEILTVKNRLRDLVGLKDEDNVKLSWTSIAEVTHYEITASDSEDMLLNPVVYISESSDYTYEILPEDGKKKYYRVKGLSATASTLDSDVASVPLKDGIVISYSSSGGLDRKYYGDPMVFDINFEINEPALYATRLTVELKNILNAEKNAVVMNYVYPQLTKVYVDGSETNLDYVSQIISKGENGYTVKVIFTDANQHMVLKQGSVITLGIKTDILFHKSYWDPILTYDTTQKYSWMELPFYIKEQIDAVEGDEDFISNSTSMMTYIRYDLNGYGEIDGSNEVNKSIDYTFENRTIIPSE